MSSPTSSPLSCQRERFSLPPGAHYLNSAYMSPLSKRVIAAGAAGMEREARPTAIEAADFFAGVDEVRARFATLVGLPEPSRVAVVPSVSYGLANVMANTALERGQNVVTLHEQFPSNVHGWRRRCAELGAELRTVRRPSGRDSPSGAWEEGVLEEIDSDTAVVSMGVVHWTDGSLFDLERIGARAREVGAALVVDGSQSVGAVPFDLPRIRPDALVCAGYKWLTGPYSIGVAYYGPRYDDGRPIEETWIGREGAQDFAGLVDPSDAYRAGAARYDVGETASFVLVPMLIAALEQILEWEVAGIEAHTAALADQLFADARLERMGMGSSRPASSHMFGLALPDGADPGAVAARLREREVYVSVRGSSVRVSPHVYNDGEDIEALVDALAYALADQRRT